MKECLKTSGLFQTIKFLRYFTAIGILCSVLLLIPGRIAAKSEPRILLITSDASVEKYRQPQEEFKQVIGLPVLEINLEDKKWDISEIEEFFYDEDPEVIYCIGTKAYLIANKYASKKPIVFSSIINWLRLPITDTTYGVSNELHAGMELMLFRYLFPQVQKIGVLYSKQYTEQWFKKTRKDAKEMEIDILGQAVQKKKTISDLKKLLPQVDAFWLISDPDLLSDKKELLAILKECDTQKIPVFSYHEAFAKIGAVLVVSADNRTIGRQAANIVTEVLAGNTLNEKVQFPAGSRIILNLSKVKEYSLEYNKAALGSVNEIIEE